jgi:hypothetical protein
LTLRRPAGARLALGLSLALAWPSPAKMLAYRGIPHPRGLSALVELSFLAHPVAGIALTLAYAVAVVAFVSRIRPGLTAGIAAVLLALATHLYESQLPVGIGRHNASLLPGAVLSAYALAHVLTRRRDTDTRDWFGIEAGAGIVAAGYVLAGSSKLLGSGIAWAEGSNLALHIATHSYSGVAFMRPLRLWVADNHSLCTVLGAGTLLLECSFALFVLREARKPYALLATAMHSCISLLMGLHHFDWLFMTLGIAFASRATPSTSSER